MEIEQGIWKIGDQPQKFQSTSLVDEALLEDQVMKDIAISPFPGPNTDLSADTPWPRESRWFTYLPPMAAGIPRVVELKRQSFQRRCGPDHRLCLEFARSLPEPDGL